MNLHCCLIICVCDLVYNNIPCFIAGTLHPIWRIYRLPCISMIRQGIISISNILYCTICHTQIINKFPFFIIMICKPCSLIVPCLIRLGNGSISTHQLIVYGTFKYRIIIIDIRILIIRIIHDLQCPIYFIIDFIACFCLIVI